MGDIAFTGHLVDSPSISTFSEVEALFNNYDLVIGNLESPLTFKDNPVPGKCCLRGSPQWAPILKKAGFHVLSLANNHILDHGGQGLDTTIQALNDSGICFTGAGKNKADACAPLFLTVNKQRIAIIARTSVIVTGQNLIQDSDPQAAFLSNVELESTMRQCRQSSDLVILLIHWGLENYNFPLATQRESASQFIQWGADLIIGHHPHVVQGFERIGNGVVTYSIGNFLFCDQEWVFTGASGEKIKIQSRLSEDNKKGMIAEIAGCRQEGFSFKPLFTRIENTGIIINDKDSMRSGQFAKLCSLFRSKNYNLFWQIYSLKCEWELRIFRRYFSRFSLKKILSLRWSHFIEFIGLVKRAIRITSQKSTNPYD